MAYNKNANKRGISLTEIMVGIVVFALAAVPSFGYLMDSVRQTSATEMENTAGIIAGAILDKILDNEEYDDVVEDMKLDKLSGMNDEDGSENNELKIKKNVFKLKLTVREVTNDKIEFNFWKTPYIKRQTTMDEEAEAGNDYKSIMNDPSAKRWKSPVKVKLSDITKHKNKTFIKDIQLKISWKDPASGRERSHDFMTIKANLSLVKTQGG